MRVAISGSHGTGKTSLLAHLGRLLADPDVFVCREIPEAIISSTGDRGFFRRGQNSVVRQLLILLQQTVDERLGGKNTKIVLVDRTLIDHLAYILCLFPELASEPELKLLRSIAAKWVKEYDAIFKLPIEFDIPDDGIREIDKEFQHCVDRMIDQLYAEIGIQPIVVRGDVEARASVVLAFLNQKLPPQRMSSGDR